MHHIGIVIVNILTSINKRMRWVIIGLSISNNIEKKQVDRDNLRNRSPRDIDALCEIPYAPRKNAIIGHWPLRFWVHMKKVKVLNTVTDLVEMAEVIGMTKLLSGIRLKHLNFKFSGLRKKVGLCLPITTGFVQWNLEATTGEDCILRVLETPSSGIEVKAEGKGEVQG